MLTIGKVARRLELNPSAIRYYERHGIIQTLRSPNGYRIYDERAIRTLRFVRRAQSLGMTLKEISELLQLRRDGQRPCQRVRALAKLHLAEIVLKIQEMESLRKELRALLKRRVAANNNELCPLIPSERQ